MIMKASKGQWGEGAVHICVNIHKWSREAAWYFIHLITSCVGTLNSTLMYSILSECIVSSFSSR